MNKRPYQPPTLQLFGRVSLLTAGGTGTMGEFRTMGMMSMCLTNEMLTNDCLP